MELSINGRGRLGELETTIGKNLKAFYKTGMALKEIRDSGLYKTVLGFGTFEDYCRERWDIGVRYAQLQMASSQVVANLENTNNCSLLPVTESQARPLSKLSPPLQIEAWTKSVETAPDGRVTARHIIITVNKILGDDEKQRFRKVRRNIGREELISESFKNVFDGLVGEIQDAKFNNWKDTSKSIVLQYLHSLIEIINI